MGQDDAARPLTDEGRRRFARVAEQLAHAGVVFDRIYHSPKLRAVQTADLLCPLLAGEFEVTPLLAAPPDIELLRTLRGERIALVGHEPWLSELCAYLMLGEHRGEMFVFKKGGVAHLEGLPSPGGMRLLALLPPRLLR